MYGLVGSQFGDINEPFTEDPSLIVKQYVKDELGFKHDFIGVAAGVVVGFTVLFGIIFAFSIKVFNFQRR